jgi:predicted peptidase
VEVLALMQGHTAERVAAAPVRLVRTVMRVQVLAVLAALTSAATTVAAVVVELLREVLQQVEQAAVEQVARRQTTAQREPRTQAEAVAAEAIKAALLVMVHWVVVALCASAISARQSDRSRVPQTQPQKRVDTPSIPSSNPETW